MPLSGDALEDHVGEIARLIERFGAVLASDEDIQILELPDGDRRFELAAILPGAPGAAVSRMLVQERWHRVGTDALERADYAYELLDRERNVRRAFHRHDVDWFVHRYSVVVHEHCERPIGVAPCAHLEGRPIRDGFAGLTRLIETWTDPEPPDCRALRCLE